MILHLCWQLTGQPGEPMFAACVCVGDRVHAMLAGLRPCQLELPLRRCFSYPFAHASSTARGIRSWRSRRTSPQDPCASRHRAVHWLGWSPRGTATHHRAPPHCLARVHMCQPMLTWKLRRIHPIHVPKIPSDPCSAACMLAVGRPCRPFA